MVANDLDGACSSRLVRLGQTIRVEGSWLTLWLVCYDRDGLWGRMITTLLTVDSIPHRLFPVEGYSELEARTRDLEGDDEVSSDSVNLLPILI